MGQPARPQREGHEETQPRPGHRQTRPLLPPDVRRAVLAEPGTPEYPLERLKGVHLWPGRPEYLKQVRTALERARRFPFDRDRIVVLALHRARLYVRRGVGASRDSVIARAVLRAARTRFAELIGCLTPRDQASLADWIRAQVTAGHGSGLFESRRRAARRGEGSFPLARLQLAEIALEHLCAEGLAEDVQQSAHQSLLAWAPARYEQVEPAHYFAAAPAFVLYTAIALWRPRARENAARSDFDVEQALDRMASNDVRSRHGEFQKEIEGALGRLSAQQRIRIDLFKELRSQGCGRAQATASMAQKLAISKRQAQRDVAHVEGLLVDLMERALR